MGIGLNARLKPRKLLILRFVKMAMMCPVLSAFYLEIPSSVSKTVPDILMSHTCGLLRRV
jgi:hypothetical protein